MSLKSRSSDLNRILENNLVNKGANDKRESKLCTGRNKGQNHVYTTFQNLWIHLGQLWPRLVQYDSMAGDHT